MDTTRIEIEIPQDVHDALADLAGRTGRAVEEEASALLMYAMMPGEIPPDVHATVVAAARELLAGESDEARLQNVTVLLTGIDPNMLLCVALKLFNALGLAQHGGDAAAWDADLVTMLGVIAYHNRAPWPDPVDMDL